MLVSIINLLMDSGVVPPPPPVDNQSGDGFKPHEGRNEDDERRKRIKRDEDDWMYLIKYYLENRN